MIKLIPCFLFMILNILQLQAGVGDRDEVVEIEHMRAKLTWSKMSTSRGDFRTLPDFIEVNKIRYQREETRIFFSIADVGPGWNSFRLVPFLPSDAGLALKSREEAILRLGLPMEEIERDNYFEWRFISINEKGECAVMFIAITFDEKEVVKELRMGRAVFPEVKKIRDQ